MNRKEMACVAAGAVLGVVGCSPGAKSLVAPVAEAQQTASEIAGVHSGKDAPHLSEVRLVLISGTTEDRSRAHFYLVPHEGWSIASSNPNLQVSIEDGHVAVVQAPEDQEVAFTARATITHTDGMHFTVRCNVEEGH